MIWIIAHLAIKAFLCALGLMIAFGSGAAYHMHDDDPYLQFFTREEAESEAVGGAIIAAIIVLIGTYV